MFVILLTVDNNINEIQILFSVLMIIVLCTLGLNIPTGISSNPHLGLNEPEPEVNSTTLTKNFRYVCTKV